MDNLGFFTSDHRPILLNSNPDVPFLRNRVTSFRFEPLWLKEDDYNSVVKAVWEENGSADPVRNLSEKLSQCASKLSIWSKERFRNFGKQIEDKSREIDRLYNVTGKPGIMEKIKHLESVMEGLLEREEIFWKQRSRIDWLQVGDRNTKFFHSKATARKRKNFVANLLDDNGVSQVSEKGMSKVVSDFYSDLFQSSNPSVFDINMASRDICSRVTEEMSELLCSRFTAEDVRVAVFDLGPNKAPGPDGFQAIFFQKAWGLIGVEVSRVCLGILNGECSMKEFNRTNVVLIPKSNNPNRIQDFRPISLCTVIYKVVTKVMSSRLKTVLPLVISQS